MCKEFSELKFFLSLETSTKYLEKSKIHMSLLFEISLGDFSNIRLILNFRFGDFDSQCYL